MPNDDGGRELLGAALHRIADTSCCHCGCEGGSCTTETGEKCELITVNIVRKRCTGVACEHAEAARLRENKRGRNRPSRSRSGKRRAA